MTVRAAVLGAVTCVAFGFDPSAHAQPFPIGVSPAAFGDAVRHETNAYRAEHGQPEVQPAAAVTHAAQKYAEYQARANTNGHHADGQDAGRRLAAEGFTGCYWSENLYERWDHPLPASWRDVAEGAMRSWRSSPAHAKNLRDPRATYMGVGVAAWRHGARNHYKVVQLFAGDCR